MERNEITVFPCVLDLNGSSTYHVSAGFQTGGKKMRRGITHVGRQTVWFRPILVCCCCSHLNYRPPGLRQWHLFHPERPGHEGTQRQAANFRKIGESTSALMVTCIPFVSRVVVTYWRLAALVTTKLTGRTVLFHFYRAKRRRSMPSDSWHRNRLWAAWFLLRQSESFLRIQIGIWILHAYRKRGARK